MHARGRRSEFVQSPVCGVDMVPVQVWAANDRFLLGALMQGDADLVTTKDLEQG
ncbi:MAG: hypothetical protein NTY08_10600 [Proteobacteria bacterium]|nr:hypothetical protein [Pseudomonadota bacterium]